MKKIIKLNESDLRNIVRKTINEVIYQNRMTPWQGEYDEFPGYKGRYKDEYKNNHMGIFNQDRLHTLNRQTDIINSYGDYDNENYAEGMPYPSVEYKDGTYTHDDDWRTQAQNDLKHLQRQRFKNKLDKQWKDTQDIEKYSKMADSRPLHRKGSLNRAFDE